MVMQWPEERDIAGEVVHRHLAGLQPLGEDPGMRARADQLAAEAAVEHRAAGDDERRQVAARRAHDQRRRRLVAAREQDHAVHRLAADRLLDVHRGEVAVEHRRRAEQDLRQAHHRELEREAAHLVDAALHVLRDLAEVAVAGRELGPGVADADDRAAVEQVVDAALVLHPAAAREAVAVLPRQPCIRAQLVLPRVVAVGIVGHVFSPGRFRRRCAARHAI
jgi:hypothetical protein